VTAKALALKPGETGLLALDWWNGNRSVLVDADLTGLLIGATISTRPERDLPRAWSRRLRRNYTIIRAF